ncbi:hypothetical protein BHF71_06255 [Vulcanibacillus modesticaldus]|uniref:HTH lacI-type domain-containing protein n=1 Tax=Vulcanibacillus modesticaldus TaxID=337097 RepID=A0A1D2YWX2_9BACI|nr:LacI family DNA-binding transcriptional regulator [Vulcanibacillus modesticaldus]OEG00123.1 hypothetical protein BHF71_06255 [Vulcanibacillus modesticaldus]
MRKTTIKDVAKYANVSIATVSRVINNSPLASKEAKKKVLQAIRELGYEPNALARGLVSRKSNTIGVLIPDVSNPFFAKVFRGMEDAVHKNNSNVFICNTDKDKERMLRYIKFLREKQVEGVIFTSEEVTKEYYEALYSLNVPVVLVATEAKEYNLPAVKVNDYQAVSDAIKYLVDNGHSNIGMISGPLEDKIAGLPRYEGYKSTLMEMGIPFNEENVVFGDYRFESGKKAIKELLSKNPEITAVFVSSDEMAIGSIVGACKMGIEVPKELSIIGYDNVSISEMSNPALTTIDQSLYQMGYQGVELLFEMIEKQKKEDSRICKGDTIYIPHRIIERESVSNLIQLNI